MQRYKYDHIKIMIQQNNEKCDQKEIHRSIAIEWMNKFNFINHRILWKRDKNALPSTNESVSKKIRP